MSMNHKIKKQSGAALFVALIILLLVTLIGVSAVRGGLFHEIMAFNAQSDELAFQAAESAINGVVNEAQNDLAVISNIYNQPTGDTVENCITRTTLKDGACTDTDTLDARASILSDAMSKFEFKAPALGTDPDALLDYQFSTTGKGHFKQNDMPFEHQNIQAWRKLGPGSGNFSDSAGLLGLGD